MITCKNPECGKEFEKTYAHRKYCSVPCRDRTQMINKNEAKKGVNKAKGWALRTERKRARERGLSHNPRVFSPKICVVCKKEYIPTSSRQKYCDPECLIKNC